MPAEREATPLIEARGLTVRRAGRCVIDGLDLALHAGERLFVVGPSGVGKSTLLLTLLGFVPTDGGCISLLGRVCRREADFAPLRGPIGLLFQDANDQLFGPTVLEDAEFGPLNQGLTAIDARMHAETALAAVGIPHLASRPVHDLSGGEQRLAALAGVLAMHPSVLLLDEPTASLDAEAATRVRDALAATRLPMLVASHDAALIDALATRRVELGKR